MIKRSTSIVAGTVALVLSQPGWGQSTGDTRPATKPDSQPAVAPVNIQNLFTPSGWMGDGEYGKKYVQFSGKETDNPHSAPTAIKVSYRFGQKNWAGIYWQNLPDNWGQKPGNNYSGSGLSKVTFWARGQTGSEVVEFKSGGIDAEGKPYRDSYTATTGKVELGRDWKQYQIPLVNMDLSSVIGGFSWVASADYNQGETVTFYLDDIVLE